MSKRKKCDCSRCQKEPSIIFSTTTGELRDFGSDWVGTQVLQVETDTVPILSPTVIWQFGTASGTVSE